MMKGKINEKFIEVPETPQSIGIKGQTVYYERKLSFVKPHEH